MANHSNPKYREHLHDERNHMEGLLNQRFNFFIIIFGFVLAAIPYVNNPNQLRLVIIAGFIIELLFTLLIGRAQRRLQINVKLLEDIKDDPIIEIKKRANKGCILNPFKYSVVKLMGYVMPIAITSVLFISIFFSKEIYNFFK